jgi:hypothetical protein
MATTARQYPLYPERRTHTHVYVRDGRPEWPGYRCERCGLYLPEHLRKSAFNGGAWFAPEEATC